jgi:hypothetical protein
MGGRCGGRRVKIEIRIRRKIEEPLTPTRSTSVSGGRRSD